MRTNEKQHLYVVERYDPRKGWEKTNCCGNNLDNMRRLLDALRKKVLPGGSYRLVDEGGAVVG